jgi:lipoprotein-releasing system permease protein
MLGVSSLIIISCISDGFNEVINSKLSGIDGHIRVRSYFSDRMSQANYWEIDSIINYSSNFIKLSSPYIEKHAILRKGNISEGVIIYGVYEDALDKIFNLDQFTNIEIKFEDNNSIIIGNKLAESMKIKYDDEIVLIDPIKIVTDRIFKAKKITVINTFQTNFPEYDRLLAFVPLKAAQEYFNYGDNISGMIMSINAPLEVEKVDMLLSDMLKMKPYITSTWKERHASLINWLNVYDVPIKLIMFFITAVAIFNIGATLWMIIIEKTKDFGILQTLGLNKSHLSYIILIEGVIIGVIGSILGVIVSLLLIKLEDVYHFVQLPNDIYFMDYLPVKISLIYFLIYPTITILFTIFFTFLPIRRATEISLSEAIRYE